VEELGNGANEQFAPFFILPECARPQAQQHQPARTREINKNFPPSSCKVELRLALTFQFAIGLERGKFQA
jgi:hypothetical protein